MARSIMRCPWAENSSFMQIYHDTEWSKPVHDDRQLFQMLLLEGQQAGLSWEIILRKRATLYEAFDSFDPNLIAVYDDKKIASLLANPGIIRNKLKINAAITNAQAYFKLCEEHGSLDSFLWSYVNFKPIDNRFVSQEQIPATSPLSDLISRDLRKCGFKFIGSTIIYSFLEAVGIINDHLLSCDFHSTCKK